MVGGFFNVFLDTGAVLSPALEGFAIVQVGHNSYQSPLQREGLVIIRSGISGACSLDVVDRLVADKYPAVQFAYGWLIAQTGTDVNSLHLLESTPLLSALFPLPLCPSLFEVLWLPSGSGMHKQAVTEVR